MAVMTYLQAIADGMRYEMRRNPDVFMLGEDIGHFGGAFKVTQGFLEEFGPDRVVDTPVAEAAIVGAAVGAALMGMRPIAEMQFADFITNAFNQVVNVAAKQVYRGAGCVPMVIRAPYGAGLRGGPFHSASIEGWFTHVPGLKVVAPSRPVDAKGLMIASIRDDNPVLYLEHKALYRSIKEEVPEGEVVTPIGKAAVAREGSDVTVVAYGAMLHRSLEAAQQAETEGISVEVIDLRTLVPIDKETLYQSVRKTSKVIIVHEDSRTGGFGGELAALIAEDCFEYLDGPITRVTGLDTPVPSSPPLEDYFLPNAQKILEAIRNLARY